MSSISNTTANTTATFQTTDFSAGNDPLLPTNLSTSSFLFPAPDPTVLNWAHKLIIDQTNEHLSLLTTKVLNYFAAIQPSSSHSINPHNPQTIGEYYHYLSLLNPDILNELFSEQTPSSLGVIALKTLIRTSPLAAEAVLIYFVLNNRVKDLFAIIANNLFSRNTLLNAFKLSTEGSDLFLLGQYLTDPQKFNFLYEDALQHGPYFSNRLVNILDQLPSNSFSINFIDLLIESKVPVETILKFLLLKSSNIELLQYFFNKIGQATLSSLIWSIPLCYKNILNLSEEVTKLLNTYNIFSFDQMFEFETLYDAIQLSVPQLVLEQFINENPNPLQMINPVTVPFYQHPLVVAIRTQTPLHIVRFLLERGAAIAAPEGNETALHYALLGYPTVQLLKLLLEYGAVINQSHIDLYNKLPDPKNPAIECFLKDYINMQDASHKP